jgi:hypothetical protein
MIVVTVLPNHQIDDTKSIGYSNDGQHELWRGDLLLDVVSYRVFYPDMSISISAE